MFEKIVNAFKRRPAPEASIEVLNALLAGTGVVVVEDVTEHVKQHGTETRVFNTTRHDN